MSIINLIDTSVYNLIIKLMNTNTTAIMICISYLGSAITLITLSMAFIILLKNKKNASYIVLNLALVFLLNRILKTIVARPRPSVLRLVVENGYSFPSGHAMVSMGFYGFLIYLIWVNIKNKKAKYPLIVLLSLLIISIGLSRIYLGVHYFTDVIGGFIIAMLYLVIFIKFLYKRNDKMKKNNYGGKNGKYI